jgi:hypothetical protein
MSNVTRYDWSGRNGMVGRSDGAYVFIDDYQKSVRENKALREELAALKAASSVPWPINDAIIKLTEAAAILLDEKSYDGHGHEEIRAALNAAKDYTNKIEGK